MVMNAEPLPTAQRLPQQRPAMVALGVGRMLLSAVALLALYFWIPITTDKNLDVSAVAFTVIGLALFITVFVWQLRRIGRSSFPILAAGETFVSVLLLFLGIFALAYDMMGLHDPSWFSQPLTRLDSLYFTITVFTTVGFGDITATNEVTRALVSLQMLMDLVFLAFLVRIVTTATQRSLARRDTQRQPAADATQEQPQDAADDVVDDLPEAQAP